MYHRLAMAQPLQQVIQDGWNQIRAGLELIVWSKLAHWNAPCLTLEVADGAQFESADGWPMIHPEFGRLICWITFSAGSEYVIKGVFMVHGHPVRGKNLSFKFKWKAILNSETDANFAEHSQEVLADNRNRDMHAFTRGIRAAQFPRVETNIVPALNMILASLDQDELRKRQPVAGHACPQPPKCD